MSTKTTSTSNNIISKYYPTGFPVFNTLFVLLILGICSLNQGCNGPADNTGTTNTDGFKTMEIKGNTWMAENLRIETEESWCYNDNDENCKVYGRLYSWEAANTACQKLGNGWRLPTDVEWQYMVEEYGAMASADIDKSALAFEALYQGGAVDLICNWQEFVLRMGLI